MHIEKEIDLHKIYRVKDLAELLKVSYSTAKVYHKDIREFYGVAYVFYKHIKNYFDL